MNTFLSSSFPGSSLFEVKRARWELSCVSLVFNANSICEVLYLVAGGGVGKRRRMGV